MEYDSETPSLSLSPMFEIVSDISSDNSHIQFVCNDHRIKMFNSHFYGRNVDVNILMENLTKVDLKKNLEFEMF